jgi:tripeptidyl-peptidase-1
MCDSRTGGVITSGGGYSNTYARPSYQDLAISSYLADASVPQPPQAYWRRDGRGYPDVSGIAHNYLVVINGTVSAIHGTSASTPTVASLLALLNDMRLGRGMAPLGFVNPLLYALAAERPQVYNDIVVGM